MNFESIKMGFFSYLEEKLGTQDNEENTQLLTNSSISIFMYSDEFKDYLVDEVGADISIFSKSITDIMEMDIVNGKLVDNSESNSDSFEKEEDNNEDFMTSAINELLSDEKIIENYDSDNSGELSKDEINIFLEELKDEDSDNLSFDSLANVAVSLQTPETGEQEAIIPSDDETVTELPSFEEDILPDTPNSEELTETEVSDIVEPTDPFNGEETGEVDEEAASEEILETENTQETTPETTPSTEAETETTPSTETEAEDNTDTQVANNAGQSNPVSTGGNSSVGGGGYTPSTSSSTPTSNTNTKVDDSMTLEELEAEKKTKTGELQDARDAVNDVYSGENDAVKDAIESKEDAQKAYDKAVKNDEKIDAKTKQDRENNLKAISDQEQVINDLNIDLNNKESEISDQESVISADESNLNALNSSLNELSSQSSDDPDKQAEIESKKAELESQIQEAETQLAQDKETLEKLKEEKADIESQIEDAETALSDLEQTKSDIESKILANCSDTTKDAMEKFNEARDNVQTVRESELKTAQQNVSEAQKALDDIDAKINEKKAEETKKDYKVGGDGQELIDQLNELGLDLSKLSNELGMSEDETADYLTELCNSEEWGNGCIDPLLLYAQIMQESGFDADVVGDGGAALGLGQFHTCAVQEVNDQYGTNYTNEDRSNPEKALEMMVLLLKYDYNSTGSTYGMLAMYNQGHASAINESAGQTYVNHVLARIGKSM